MNADSGDKPPEAPDAMPDRGTGSPLPDDGARRVGAPLWIVGGLVLIAAAVGVLAALFFRINNESLRQPDTVVESRAVESPAGDEVLTIAVAASGTTPAMIGYVGNLREHPLPVPAGRYYIESLRADGSVVSFGLVNVGSFGFSTAVEGTPAGKSVIDPSRAEQLTSLLEFLVDVERAKLTALSIASSGFTAPLFDTSTSTNGMVGLEDLYALYAEIAEHEQAVLSALDGFRAVASAGPKVAAAVPVLGVIDAIRGVKNELLGFFGFVGDAGQRMRERILRVSPRLGPDDKEEAFGAVPEATRGGATNFDELVGLLKNGDLDHHAAVIFGKLQSTSAAFNFEAQGVLGDRPGLAVAHEEGAELVTKGAELNAKIIRTVLAARFPDISDGFDLADKADAWAQYVTGIYTDPLGTLEGQARERVKERIADRIKVDLQSRFPDFSEALTEEIAEAIGEKVVGGNS